MEVGGTTYVAAKGVVLNTGTTPSAPPIEGLADTPYWTNRDAVQLTELPGSVIVLGGGAIGCEFAQVFARFGVRVTVVEVADRLLAPEEPEASAALEKAFAAEGIQVLAGVKVGSVRHADGSFTVDLGDQEVSADKLLVAAGRRNNLGDIGLELLGIDPDGGPIDTDERMRPGIACGRSVTSPARVASRTFRCTRQPWRSGTSWGRTVRGQTTGPYPESPSLRRGRLGGHDRAPGPGVRARHVTATGDLGGEDGWPGRRG